VEYLRAFLIGREAWRRPTCLRSSPEHLGCSARTWCAPSAAIARARSAKIFDLVARMHRHLRDRRADYHISFVPDPVCWTEVPGDLRSLARQPRPLAKGVARCALAKPRHALPAALRAIGWLALPYLWLFELLAPVIELGRLCDYCAGGMAWCPQPGIFSAVYDFSAMPLPRSFPSARCCKKSSPTNGITTGRIWSGS